MQSRHDIGGHRSHLVFDDVSLVTCANVMPTELSARPRERRLRDSLGDRGTRFRAMIAEHDATTNVPGNRGGGAKPGPRTPKRESSHRVANHG